MFITAHNAIVFPSFALWKVYTYANNVYVLATMFHVLTIKDCSNFTILYLFFIFVAD